MDETHIHPRSSAISSRMGIVGGVGMSKPEVILPPFSSGAGACTAAFCVSAAGVVAPHFVVVDGQAPGHGIVTVTGPDGFKKDAALASWLNDGAIVWRRSPPGMEKAVFDVWCEMFSKFSRSYYPEEAKILSLDGAKVHLSPKGLLVLLRSNVNFIAEPSRMSHILQALDNSSAFGRYQPKVRSRVREISFECRDAARSFKTPELMRSIAGAASEALIESALRTAFRRVGIWPLGPSAVSREELSEEAEAPVASVDLELLTRRLPPSVRRDIKCPRVVNGTLSTAGRGTALTAPEVLDALEGEAAAKMARRAAKEAGKRDREAKAAEKKVLSSETARAKRYKQEAKEDALLREIWAEVACDAAREDGCRMRANGMTGPSAAKPRRRTAAARARRTPDLPLSVHRLWCVVLAQASQMGRQTLSSKDFLEGGRMWRPSGQTFGDRSSGSRTVAEGKERAPVAGIWTNVWRPLVSFQHDRTGGRRQHAWRAFGQQLGGRSSCSNTAAEEWARARVAGMWTHLWGPLVVLQWQRRGHGRRRANYLATGLYQQRGRADGGGEAGHQESYRGGPWSPLNLHRAGGRQGGSAGE